MSAGQSVDAILQEALKTFPATHTNVQNLLLSLVPLQSFFLQHGLNFQDKLNKLHSSQAGQTLQEFRKAVKTVVETSEK